MAWYPGAKKMELQPESDAQPAIRPTQLIVHSIVGPWTARRTYEYWRDSTNLESHFGIGYSGDIAQYIGTETRADANAGANRRWDGTGAISVETASNTSASDRWTAAQVEQLVQLGVWMHEHHGVPLRICRSHSDPGFGYHRLFSQWSTSGTACPGPARIRQFRDEVFPAIVARANGKPAPQEDDPMAGMTAEDITRAVWLKDHIVGVPEGWGAPGNTEWKPASILIDIGKRTRALEAEMHAQRVTIDKLADAVGKAGQFDPEVLKAEIREAIESITVRLDTEGV